MTFHLIGINLFSSDEKFKTKNTTNQDTNEKSYEKAYLAGKTKASSSAARCLLIMLRDGGIPRAVAIVSPLSEGSRTTSAPCTPESKIAKVDMVKNFTFYMLYKVSMKPHQIYCFYYLSDYLHIHQGQYCVPIV